MNFYLYLTISLYLLNLLVNYCHHMIEMVMLPQLPEEDLLLPLDLIWSEMLIQMLYQMLEIFQNCLDIS